MKSPALSFFDYLLNFPREIEHIWLKSFSLPTLLYIFARYGYLIFRGLQFPLSYAPAVSRPDTPGYLQALMAIVSNFDLKPGR